MANAEKDVIASSIGGYGGECVTWSILAGKAPIESELSMDLSELATTLISTSEGLNDNNSVGLSGNFNNFTVQQEAQSFSMVKKSTKKSVDDSDVENPVSSAMVSIGPQSSWVLSRKTNFFSLEKALASVEDVFEKDDNDVGNNNGQDDEEIENHFVVSKSLPPGQDSNKTPYGYRNMMDETKLSSDREESFAEDPPLNNIDALTSNDE
eukprot:5986285-Ditylum_brightwellii.AAC.1